MRPLAVSALLTLLLAGCVAPPPETTDPQRPVEPFVDPIVADHDHTDPTIHKRLWNIEQTAHDPLAGAKGKSAYVHALDVKAGWLFAATWGDTVDLEGGFWIFDLTDPEHPKPTGRYRIPGSVNGDLSMMATADGNFVVISTEPLTSFGTVSPFGPGVYLVDVTDKSAPKLAQYLPGRGTHSIIVHKVGERDIVYGGATQDQMSIYEIVRTPVPHLVPLGSRPMGEGGIAVDDPLLGAPALYVSNGFAGYEIYDISTPETPTLVATWNIPDRGDKYYIHTSTVTFLDGKRIIVVTSEDWKDYPSALWVLDATDLASFELLSTWHNPGGHPADDIRFSLHNPRFDNGTLWLTHYHAGVWALDLSTPQKQRDPEVLGVFIPGEDVGGSPTPPLHAYMRTRGRGFATDMSPMVFDVARHAGVTYVADAQTGLYAIKPTWAG